MIILFLELGDESWAEMVLEAVADEVALQRELVYSVSLHDLPEALKWAQLFNVDRQFWPCNLLDFEKSPGINPSDSYEPRHLCSENWDDVDNGEELKNNMAFYTFKLPKENVLLINEEIMFQNLLDIYLMVSRESCETQGFKVDGLISAR